MNIFLLISLAFAGLAIAIFLLFKILKTEFTYNNNEKISISDILAENNFIYSIIQPVNFNLTLALNRTGDKIAIVKNFNPNNMNSCTFEEISVSYLDKIEKNNICAKIHYIKNAQKHVLTLYPLTLNLKNFIHEVYKNANIKRIQNKHKIERNGIFSASNWNCEYVWGYFKRKNTFSYLKTQGTEEVFDVNLRKAHFTIDTKYNYLEMPVYGIAQHLSIYDKNFLNEMYFEVMENIKNTTDAIAQNSIYYNYDDNMVYLTNGETSIQSIALDKTNDVLYRENRISFSLKYDEKTINFMSSTNQIKEFQDFITNYNLKKIASNFDFKYDKLINITQNTKFIFDFSRDRLVYCVNLEKLSSFSYMTIAFDNLSNATIEKSGAKFFVRIKTKDNEIFDVTCDKKEIAQYIEAQIIKLIN